MDDCDVSRVGKPFSVTFNLILKNICASEPFFQCFFVNKTDFSSFIRFLSTRDEKELVLELLSHVTNLSRRAMPAAWIFLLQAKSRKKLNFYKFFSL